MSDDKSPLWVVTSYFNPSKYRQRYENFQTFRRFLNAPLLVVELERDGDFQLTQADGDIVLQLTGEDRLWQKERLLNIGIAHLPAHVEYVAWVDCDVVFASDDWCDLAIAHLQNEGGILQLFEEAHHLTQDATQTAQSVDQLVKGESFFTQIAFARGPDESAAFFAARVSDELGRHGPNGHAQPPKGKVAMGMAWATRRNEIQQFGLYDRSVVGGGDGIFVCAINNWFEALMESEHYGTVLKADAQNWAKQARQRICPVVSALPMSLVHLWHGDFQNRQYRDRHKMLIRNRFNPDQDIRLAANGVWEWSDPSSQLAQDVAAYFESRREDG